MADLVRELDNQNVEDADQRELIILRALKEPILKSQGIRALSDTKAAMLILARLDEAEVSARKSNPNSTRLRMGEEKYKAWQETRIKWNAIAANQSVEDDEGEAE